MTTDSKGSERGTFQEVAKLAAMPEPATGSTEEKKENSGMIDLGALSAGETSQPSHPLASASSPPVSPRPPRPMDFKAGKTADPPPAWIPAPVPTAPWLPMVGSPTPPSTAAPSPSPSAPINLVAGGSDPRFFPRPEPLPFETTRPTSMGDDNDFVLPKKGSGTVWIALGGGMALGALAAGIFFGMRGSAPSQAGGALATPQMQSAWVPTIPPNDTKVAVAVPAPEDHPVQSSALTPAVDKHAKPLGATLAVHALNSPPSFAAAVPAADEATAPLAVPVAALPTTTPSAGAPAPGSDQSLEALMRKAIGPQPERLAPRSQPTPSAGTEAGPASNGNLPFKPAIGAVQGALGTVLPAARYCLGPDDPVSRAAITFKSDGSVQNVAVTGDAAGQPAEGCIRSRLMTARVPPFSSPTFTWTVTVRPAN